MRVRIQVKNYKEIMAKLRSDVLLSEPWKQGMSEIGDLGYDKGQERAPRGTGGLAGSLAKKMSNKPVPTWVKVRTNRSRKGFRYGYALNSSRRVAYHYRSGPYKGKRTYHWLTGIIDVIRGDVNRILAGVAREVEKRWAR